MSAKGGSEAQCGYGWVIPTWGRLWRLRATCGDSGRARGGLGWLLVTQGGSEWLRAEQGVAQGGPRWLIVV